MQIRFAFVSAVAMLVSATCIAQEAVRVGERGGAAVVAPTGQLLRPAGATLEFAGRPVDLALSPDGKTLYAKDNRGVVVVDTASWSIRQEASFPEGGGSMHGIAVSASGEVFATTAQSHVWTGSVDPEGLLDWSSSRELTSTHMGGAAHGAGMALGKGRHPGLLCMSRANTLAVLGPDGVAEEIPVGVAPYDVIVSPDGSTAYVSNWGGRRPGADDLTAPSSGTDVVVDERGVGASGTVSVVDLATRSVVAEIAVGLHASDMVLTRDGSRLYVANANSDTVTEIDTRTRKVARSLSVRPDPRLAFGSMPNALALSEDDQTLYVACGGNNAVAVLSLGAENLDDVVQGFIPAGWFPSALLLDGGYLYIANVKGVGSRSQQDGDNGWNVHRHRGSVQRVAVPVGRDALASYTSQVIQDGRVPHMLRANERAQSSAAPRPVPAQVGQPSVFEHVVYVIKENRTYDQVLGDMAQGNGDPSLCIFGLEVTPNHHALAEQFALLDNYYCNGVNSADGHSWTTEGNVTDHLEKSFGGFTRSYTWGNDALTYSSSGFIWDNVLAHGLTFRNFGEMDYAEPIPQDASFEAIYRDFVDEGGEIGFAQDIGIDRLSRYSSPTYPGWNMRIPDVLRADRFLTELAGFEERGDLPNFTIVYLPNDHTSGTSPGAPTPRAQVADNDLALGRVVDGITHSRFWPKTCIFIIEDDPQAGFDHVDGHRSLCLVVSPYTARGTVVSDFYNQTSVLHTMQRILGLPPMNQMDAMSPLMETCFVAEADLAPYDALPNTVPLDEMNPEVGALRGGDLHWAMESIRQPFDEFDAADEDTLNRILWHATQGADAPYPAHVAGAHGSGLSGRDLILTGDDDDD
jgi:YVTN family beta-propeller protein